MGVALCAANMLATPTNKMLYDSVLLELHHILPDIVHPAKDSIATAFKKSIDYGKNDDYEESIKWAMIIEDWSWERLHSGHWMNVPVGYRGMYSLACVLRATGLIELGRSDEALSVIDKGLLLGNHGDMLQIMVVQLTRPIDELKTVSETKRKNYNNETVLLKKAKHNGGTSTSSTIASTDGAITSSTIIASTGETITNSSTTACNNDIHCLNKYIQIERINCPSLETFLNDYMKPDKPVIITGCMGHWPAMTNRRWSLDYLKRMIGPRTVPVELGSRYTDDKWSQRLMTVNEFISDYIESDSPVKGYLAQHQLFQQVPQLQSDIVVPDYCCCCVKRSSYEDGCQDINEEDIKINVWFGPSGTISPLHYDPQHNLLAQVVGSKYIVLYDSSDIQYLYPHGGILINTSQVDIDNPDYNTYPLFTQAKGYHCVLEEGEMLYIPIKWWHYVKSLSISCSVSFWWS